MDVYWFEQTFDDVPERNNWLGAQERLRLAALRFPKRRAEWRLGRWTAKCAVALYQQLPIAPEILTGIEISTESSGAPYVVMSNVASPPAISISHRSGIAMCALTDTRAKVGCDLELIEPHSASFLIDYFTQKEQDFVAQTPWIDRPLVMSLLWSAKESALKAMQIGLRLDARSLAVSVEPQHAAHWASLRVTTSTGELFHGWWREADGMVYTIVSDSPVCRPVSLKNRDYGEVSTICEDRTGRRVQ